VLITYHDAQGVLRRLLADCTRHGWTVTALAADASGPPGDLGDLATSARSPQSGQVSVAVTLAGRDVHRAAHTLGAVDGVTAVDQLPVDDEQE